MSRARACAVLGCLWQVEPAVKARRLVVSVVMPDSEIDQVFRSLGPPPAREQREEDWQRGRLPMLALLPARVPRHPETESDILAESAAAFLAAGLEAGTLRLTPALSLAFDRLREAIDGQPITFPIPEAS